MGLFSGIEKVKVKSASRDSAPFITKPGSFTARVVYGKAGTSENPKRLGESFILLTLEVERVIDGDYVEGERCSFWRPVKGEHNLRDIKAAAMALTGADDSEITADVLTELFKAEPGGAPPVVGLRARLNVVPNRRGATDKDGNLYVNTFWSQDSSTSHDAGF